MQVRPPLSQGTFKSRDKVRYAVDKLQALVALGERHAAEVLDRR